MSSIYHVNYSENLSQMWESGLQTSHFIKAQYSLQCKDKRDSESENLYLYHKSDVRSYGNPVTVPVVHHILSLKTPPDIIRFKVDSCSIGISQNIFYSWSYQAQKLAKKHIIYYGVPDHDDSG